MIFSKKIIYFSNLLFQNISKAKYLMNKLGLKPEEYEPEDLWAHLIYHPVICANDVGFYSLSIDFPIYFRERFYRIDWTHGFYIDFLENKSL